jgi:hypothetical protein
MQAKLKIVRVVLPLESVPGPGVVFENAPDGADPVAPADFFAFVVSAAVVGDAYLVDAASHPGHLGGNFRFEAKALLRLGPVTGKRLCEGEGNIKMTMERGIS